MAEVEDAKKRDFADGFLVRDLADGAMAAGQACGEDVVLVRRGDEFLAVGANCTHYHAALSQGLVVGDTLRCPLHHACFSLRTGEALRAPAFDPIPRWRVERIGDKVFVREKLAEPDRKQSAQLRGGTEPYPSRFGCDHRRRRRGPWSRGHAAPGRLRWPADHDQRG